MELIGLYLIAGALLVAAGVSKAIRPTDTARALTALVAVPLGRMRVLVRVGSLAEAALGVVAITMPRSASACLVAVSYAVFAVVVAVARSRGGAIASCGCFGTPDTPATMLHVVVNLGLSASAASVALAGPTGSMVSILSRQPWHGVPLVVVSALGAWLAYLVIAVMAQLQGARGLTAISFRSEP